MSTGPVSGGGWRRSFSAIARGSLLFFGFSSHPSGVQGGEGWGGYGGRQVGPNGGALGGRSPTSLASVWLSRGRIV